MNERPASQSAMFRALVADALHRAVEGRTAPATLALAVRAYVTSEPTPPHPDPGDATE